MVEFITDKAIREALAELTLEDIPEQYRNMAEAIGFKAFGKLIRYCNGHQLYIQKNDHIGIYEKNRDLVEAIGMEAFNRLINFLSGEPVYIPKCREIAIPARNRLIINEFNGYNFFELGHRWDLTDRTIRNIVKNKKKEIKYRPMEGQITFFDYRG